MNMMTQLIDELTVLGFSGRIAETYVLLAQRGELTVREVSEQFSLARGTTHDMMMSLVEHGLARVRMVKKEKIFVLESPIAIRQKLEEQHRLCTMRLERFESVLPNLQALVSLGGGPTSAVRYLEGPEAIIASQREFMLLPDDIIQLFGDEISSKVADVRRWANVQAGKNVRSIVIANRFPDDLTTSCHDVRVIPRSVLAVSGEIRVCADRVLLLSYVQTPVAIEIRSQVMADVCRAALELAWHTAGKIEEWMA